MIGRLVALAVCAVALVGVYFTWQDWEQGREEQAMIYEPGVYQGPSDTPLDSARQEELRARVRNQNSI